MSVMCPLFFDYVKCDCGISPAVSHEMTVRNVLSHIHDYRQLTSLLPVDGGSYALD